LPALQLRQMDEPVLSWYVPTEQAAQEADLPPAEYAPAGQAVQLVVAT